MSFDIANARAKSLDTGAFLHFTDPSGLPLYDDDKRPVGVYLRARNSRAGLAAVRANGNRRLETARKQGAFTTTVETNEGEMTELLVSLTMSFTFDVYEGQPFDSSPENARKFWGDDANIRWRRDAEDFVNSEANFTKA